MVRRDQRRGGRAGSVDVEASRAMSDVPTTAAARPRVRRGGASRGARDENRGFRPSLTSLLGPRAARAGSRARPDGPRASFRAENIPSAGRFPVDQTPRASPPSLGWGGVGRPRARMSAGCECPRPGSVAWIRDAFADCVYSPVDVAGFALGLASIACWLVAQLPQFIQNFRLKSAESLSPWFLAEWLLGDTFNLLGCLMTGDQLATETYTAVYFMCVDVAMIFQFVYYTLRARDAWELVSADLRDPVYARLEGAADDVDDDEDEDEDEGEGRGEGVRVGGREGREGEGANAASGRRAAAAARGGEGGARSRGRRPSRRSRRGPSPSPSLSRSASSFPFTGSGTVSASKAGRTIRTPRPRGFVREGMISSSSRGIPPPGIPAARFDTAARPSTRRGRRSSGARSGTFPAPFTSARGSRRSSRTARGVRARV